MMDRVVYVFGGESRIHTGVLHDGQLLTNERCNVDDIPDGERVWVTELESVDPPGRELCRRCFPGVEVPSDVTEDAGAQPVIDAGAAL